MKSEGRDLRVQTIEILRWRLRFKVEHAGRWCVGSASDSVIIRTYTGDINLTRWVKFRHIILDYILIGFSHCLCHFFSIFNSKLFLEN